MMSKTVLILFFCAQVVLSSGAEPEYVRNQLLQGKIKSLEASIKSILDQKELMAHKINRLENDVAYGNTKLKECWASSNRLKKDHDAKLKSQIKSHTEDLKRKDDYISAILRNHYSATRTPTTRNVRKNKPKKKQSCSSWNSLECQSSV